ncbi:MAG: 2TM domain-containing protein [Actinomycetota bacterium]
MTTPTEARSPRSQPDERLEAASRWAEQRHAFFGHAGGFATGMFIMFAVNLATTLSAGTAGDWNAWWSAWALVGWSSGLAVHGLVVWLNRPSIALPTVGDDTEVVS